MKRSLKLIILSLFFLVMILLTNTKNSIISSKKSFKIFNYSSNIKYAISQEKNWILEIPKINLCATISEGVEENILDYYIGHFEETNYIYGNVVLAAHNRGYNVNYFGRIKELEKGDKIIYRCGTIKNNYIVNSEKIIEDTNVEILEKTKENRITLITCVENKPHERRAIIGILEKREE